MNVVARWENTARTVIRYTYSGEWNWDDFYTAFDAAQPCPTDRRICVLLDLRQVTHFPNDAILHLKRAMQIAEQVTGIILVIATDAPVTTTFSLLVSVYKPGERFQQVANDEEAFAILQMPP